MKATKIPESKPEPVLAFNLALTDDEFRMIKWLVGKQEPRAATSAGFNADLVNMYDALTDVIYS